MLCISEHDQEPAVPDKSTRQSRAEVGSRGSKFRELSLFGHFCLFLPKKEQIFRGNIPYTAKNKYSLPNFTARRVRKMFKLFKKKDENVMVVSIKHQLKEAFSNVTYDMENIKQWVNHLNEKSQVMEDSHNTHKSTTQKDIENINLWVHYLHKHNSELQKYVREVTTNLLELHKRDTEIMERLKALEIRSEMQNTKSVSEPVHVEVRTKSEPKSGTGPSKQTKFEEKIMFQLKSKRKEYIINQIMNLIAVQSLSTKELEEKIVTEGNLCGRTTFYDYLKELRHKNIIGDKNTGSRTILVELSSVPN